MLALAVVKLHHRPDCKFVLYSSDMGDIPVVFTNEKRECNILYYKFLQGFGYNGKYVGEKEIIH